MESRRAAVCSGNTIDTGSDDGGESGARFSLFAFKLPACRGADAAGTREQTTSSLREPQGKKELVTPDNAANTKVHEPQ